MDYSQSRCGSNDYSWRGFPRAPLSAAEDGFDTLRLRSPGACPGAQRFESAYSIDSKDDDEPRFGAPSGSPATNAESQVIVNVVGEAGFEPAASWSRIWE
jgi:hypothetical protein